MLISRFSARRVSVDRFYHHFLMPLFGYPASASCSDKDARSGYFVEVPSGRVFSPF
jgi:hypothetical protein